MTVVLLVAVGAPGWAAAISRLLGLRGPGRVIAGATGVAFACAVALAVQVAVGATPPDADLLGGVASLAVGELRADPVAAVLLVLVLGVSWVVQHFALRLLVGDVQRGRFATLAGALTTAAALTAAAASLVGMAMAWTATSIALCALVGLYRGNAIAREGVGRTARALLVGDAALWLAVAILSAQVGIVRIAELPEAAAALGTETAIVLGLLVLVAAASRSVQVPFHGWLPATLASPTPVSALLHAGVVNAGAVLLLRWAPVSAEAPIAMIATIVVGAVTAATGTILMLARPDVKGALAQSTVAQMGFMVLTCGLGLWAAALLHLAAHGAYKAARFLGAGGAVEEVTAARAAGGVPHGASPGATLVAIVVAGAPLGAMAWALDVPDANLLLLGFAWAALALAGRGWIAASPGARGTLEFAALAVVLGPVYALLVETFAHAMAPSLPSTDGAPSAWLLLPAALLIAAGPAIWARGPQALRDRLYVWALTVGDGSRPPRGRRGNPAPILVVDPEGSRP